MAEDEQTPAGALVQKLLEGGFTIDSIGSRVQRSPAQVRRLRAGTQPHAEEDVLVKLARLAAVPADRLETLIFENALQRLPAADAAAVRGVVTAQRRLRQPTSGYLTTVTLPAAQRQEYRIAAVAGRVGLVTAGSIAATAMGSWAPAPGCIYVQCGALDAGLMAGAIGEVDLHDQPLYPGAWYLVQGANETAQFLRYEGKTPSGRSALFREPGAVGVTTVVALEATFDDMPCVLGLLTKVVFSQMLPASATQNAERIG